MNELSAILFNIAQSLPGFLIAIVVHEAAHAWVADMCGDPTAKNQGRLTLNPLAHYDPIGTVFFPLLGAVSGAAIFGWARPVPVEMRNFKKWRSGVFWVSFAGPLSNLIMGALFSLALSLIVTKVSPDWSYHAISIGMLQSAVLVNFVLAVFNLIPLPPLDGSKMVTAFLKGAALRQYEELARFTPIIFISTFALSYFAKIHVFGYLLMPAYWMANWCVFSFIGMFGGIG